MLISSILPSREEIIKERELERLKRYLFIKFGRRPFDMYWTELQTSYTDYSSIFVKHNIQTSDHKIFSEQELRMIRQAHALHERGHIEYDISGVTYNWKIDNHSLDEKDWSDNIKYPMDWLNFFACIMIDVRMENFVILDNPDTKPFLDYSNNYWRFGIRGENAGNDRIYDFRECMGSRGFNLIDIPEWHPDSVELVDSVQFLIKAVQFSSNTYEAMENTLLIVKQVWPTIYRWLDEDDQLNKNIDDSVINHDTSTWGDPEDVKKNNERVKTKFQLMNTENSEDSIEEPVQSDLKKIITKIQNEIESDESAAEEELEPYKKQLIEVEIEQHKKRQAYSEQVVLKPFYEHDLDTYKLIKNSIQPLIRPIGLVLKKLTEGKPAKKVVNQKSGKLNASKVWSATTTDNTNIFSSKTNPKASVNARLLVLNDVSGSTGSTVESGETIIDIMKKSLVLLSEATEFAKIETATYAFTEEYEEMDDEECNSVTTIFPIKPYGKLTDRARGYIGGLSPREGNRDTLSLQWAINELKKYHERVRLLIVISDGSPCFEENEDEQTMRGIVQQAQRQGIEVICLFIGPKDLFNNVKVMYPGGAIPVTNNLVRDLMQQVTQIIKRRRN